MYNSIITMDILGLGGIVPSPEEVLQALKDKIIGK